MFDLKGLHRWWYKVIMIVLFGLPSCNLYIIRISGGNVVVELYVEDCHEANLINSTYK